MLKLMHKKSDHLFKFVLFCIKTRQRCYKKLGKNPKIATC